MSDLLEDAKEEVKVAEPGDHDRFKHYVRKEQLQESILNGGTPIQALCGKVWTPSLDYDRFPLCDTCKEIYESLADG